LQTSENIVSDKTVTEIIESQDDLDVYREREIELDEKELRRYIDVVLKEVKREDKSSRSTSE
jgi:hypothetical protein